MTRWLNRRAIGGALLAGLTLAPGAARVAPQATAPATPCAAIAAAEPQVGHKMPSPAPVLFAPDFPQLTDCEWGFPLGGWGGIRRHAPLTHTPVIFVHGNQVDAENWYLPADHLAAHAGYTLQEMYALSYNGMENAYAGLPVTVQPAPESVAYWSLTKLMPFCCNGGNGGSDDPNVPDLYNFVMAVRDYTGSPQVDLVAHSLGGTIVRRLLMVHPELRQDVPAVVLIAAANHGTTVCRGLQASYYGCEEIGPGTDWLARLNAAGEAVGPTRWMSIYNGTDNTDPFYQQGPTFDDRQSPHLEGADNRTFPMTYHNDLRVEPGIIDVYLQFLLAHGQAPLPPLTPPAAPGGGGRPAVGPGLPDTSR